MKILPSSTIAAIDNLIEQLATAAPMPNAANPYGYEGKEASAIRRENLRHYLQWMVAARPLLLLVGEAPGYRGCAMTGVPFTNNHLLLNELSPWSQIVTGRNGFRATEEVKRPREATAAIMWQALRGLGVLPLLWNAFPFHPHQPERSESNRRPTHREIALGGVYLIALLDIFKPERVVAVGNCAAESLMRLGIAHAKIRHPSHGGKQAFTAQLGALLSDTNSTNIRVHL
jgi:uracil-DNA glycosylase